MVLFAKKIFAVCIMLMTPFHTWGSQCFEQPQRSTFCKQREQVDT